MAVAIKVPSVGESITEGTIVSWRKKTGDLVHEGDVLFELETDKATTDIPAPATGKLQITTPENATVAIGAVVGQIDDSAAEKAPPAPQKPSQTPPPKLTAPTDAPKAAPPAPRSAGDDDTALRPKSPLPPPPAKTLASHGERRERMSAIRVRIAERLVASQKATASLTTFNEADMSAIMTMRARYKASFKDKHQVNLGFMPFFVKACVAALQRFPIVNAFLEGSDIVYHDAYHIGVAVSTEKGLMVPVLRDADRMTFAQIDQTIAELAAKARDGKVAVQDLQGGTFTITNGGVFGSLLSTPILNPPQSAILGMHTIQKRPIAVEDRVEIRPMMYLALSYDHRLIDGREAVQFLVRVKECVENPERLLLEV